MSTNPISEELLAEMLANWREGYSLSTQEARMFDQIAAVLDRAADSLSYETCVDCGGTGLALNMAGEPDMCPECKGNTVVPADSRANQAVVTEEMVETATTALYGTQGIDGRVVTMLKDEARITARLAIEAALSRAEGQEPVAVKPLEWGDQWAEHRSISGHSKRRIMARALTPFMAYFIEQSQDDESWWVLERLMGDEIAGPFEHEWQARAAAQADYEQRIRSALVKAPAPAATHRHKKRGTEYVLIGIGKMQAKGWWKREVDHHGTARAADVDMHPVAIYQSTDDGSLWARPIEEWEDGRFEALATPSQPQAKGEGE